MPNPFTADVPVSPVLVREQKRAKDLLQDLRGRRERAFARFRYSHARFAPMSDDEIREAARLTDARFVVAREYGFSDWARYKAYIDALGGKREVRQPFETELQYYRDRAGGMLSVLETGERNALRLVRLYHPLYAAASEADIRAA